MKNIFEIKNSKNKVPVHTFLIVDDSQSMADKTDLVRSGLEEFFNAQVKQASENEKFSFYTFSMGVSTVVDGVHYSNLSLNAKCYDPRGMGTALYDAVGTVLDSKSFKYALENSEKVVLIIQTDGLENCSKKYSSVEVKSRMEQLDKLDNVTMVFLGEGADGWANSSVMGQNTSIKYDGFQTKAIYAGMASLVHETRMSSDSKLSSLSARAAVEKGIEGK